MCVAYTSLACYTTTHSEEQLYPHPLAPSSLTSYQPAASPVQNITDHQPTDYKQQQQPGRTFSSERKQRYQ